MTPQEQPDSQYRNKKTGTIYASVSFNDTPIAEVTTDAGAVFAVRADNLEKVEPDSQAGDEIDQLVFEFAIGREKTVPPHIRTALINSQPTVKKLKVAIAAYAERLAAARTDNLLEEIKAIIVSPKPTAYQRIQMIQRYIIEHKATLTKKEQDSKWNFLRKPEDELNI